MRDKNQDISIHSQQTESTGEFDKTTFDEYAGLYEKFSLLPYRTELEIPAIKACLGDLTGLKILDFGCGSGFFSRWLKDNGAAEVSAYDISDGMLDYVRRREEKEHKGITVLTALDESHTGKFDIVLAVYVLPYAPHPNALLSLCRDMSRVLKPGGRVITLPIHPDFHPGTDYYQPYGFTLTDLAPRGDGSLLRLNLRFATYDINLHAYYWPAETLQDAFSQSGFGPITWHRVQLPSTIKSEREKAFLLPYVLRPHAALIACVKAG